MWDNRELIQAAHQVLLCVWTWLCLLSTGLVSHGEGVKPSCRPLLSTQMWLLTVNKMYLILSKTSLYSDFKWQSKVVISLWYFVVIQHWTSVVFTHVSPLYLSHIFTLCVFFFPPRGSEADRHPWQRHHPQNQQQSGQRLQGVHRGRTLATMWSTLRANRQHQCLSGVWLLQTSRCIQRGNCAKYR